MEFLFFVRMKGILFHAGAGENGMDPLGRLRVRSSIFAMSMVEFGRLAEPTILFTCTRLERIISQTALEYGNSTKELNLSEVKEAMFLQMAVGRISAEPVEFGVLDPTIFTRSVAWPRLQM